MLLALVPLGPEVDALAATAMVMVALIAYEAIRFPDAREQIRHQGASGPR